MALNPRQRLAAILLASGGFGLLASMVATRVADRALRLPDDVRLADLSGAPTESGDMSPGIDAPDDSEPVADAGSSPGRVGPASKQSWIDPIVRRNIFDSSKVGGSSQTGGDVAEDGRRTDLKIVLLATIVADPPEYSSALIAEEKGSSSGYGIGDSLLDQATILRIEQKKVFIRRNEGNIEYISMDDVSSRGEDREPTGDSGDSEANGVTKDGDNKFVVERSVVDQALQNPEALAKQVRVSPHKDANGEVDGYRLSGVRRNSLMDKLGIKNGDIVHTVNGKPLDSTSAALDAYNSMQNSSSFSFEVTRRNKRQTFDYEIR